MFQKKNVGGIFIIKLSQSINGWENKFFFLADGHQINQNTWNKRRALPNYEVEAKQGFIEEQAQKLIQYSFGMILREGCWDEKMLSYAGFYSPEESDLHELN